MASQLIIPTNITSLEQLQNAVQSILYTFIAGIVITILAMMQRQANAYIADARADRRHSEVLVASRSGTQASTSPPASDAPSQ